MLKFDLSCKEVELSELMQIARSKDEELGHLHKKVAHYEQIIFQLNSSMPKPQTVIKKIPVFIEKDVIIEVPVPIYINQKEQKVNARLMPLLASSQIEKSIGVNQIDDDSMEI